MRKASIIAMAALALLTAQCKKNEPKPEEKVMVPITGSVDFGGSKTEITTLGMINPKDGDVIYIYDNGTKVGSMTCTAQTGQQFTCSGTIQTTSIDHECTFMYLGTGSTDAGGNPIIGTNTTISFADQRWVSVSNDNKISGLEKFHVGSCKATVPGTGTVTLPMATKMSIAYFQLTDGTTPIADQDVTISGVYATATIDKINGTLKDGIADNITVHTDDDGCFYMALIPQSGSVTFTFAVEGYKNATNVFPNGIRECSFYSDHGSGDPLPVTVEVDPLAPQAVGWTNATSPKAFSVSSTKKVYFSQGNLQWSSSGTHSVATGGTAAGTWKFAEHQFDYLGDNGQGSTSQTVDRDLFGWGTSEWDGEGLAEDKKAIYYMPYDTDATDSHKYGPHGSYSIIDTYANYDWGVYNDISNDGLLGVGSWRLLEADYYYSGEWYYMIHTRGNAADLHGYGKVGDVCGLIILPDEWNWNASGVSHLKDSWVSSSNSSSSSWPNIYSYSDWHAMETEGAVFLPAAGGRSKTTLSHVGALGQYWLSGNNDEIEKIPFLGMALNIVFGRYSPSYWYNAGIVNNSRDKGFSVRLVRDAN